MTGTNTSRASAGRGLCTGLCHPAVLCRRASASHPGNPARLPRPNGAPASLAESCAGALSDHLSLHAPRAPAFPRVSSAVGSLITHHSLGVARFRGDWSILTKQLPQKNLPPVGLVCQEDIGAQMIFLQEVLLLLGPVQSVWLCLPFASDLHVQLE